MLSSSRSPLFPPRMMAVPTIPPLFAAPVIRLHQAGSWAEEGPGRN